MRALLALAACTACIEPSYITCGDGLCPAGDVCSADETCVSPAQLAACVSIADGEKCTFADSVGFCHHGACVTTLRTCGDGVSQLSLDEQCDCGTADLLAAPPPGCNGFNGDTASASCRSNCVPAKCGDTIVDANELCDDGNTIPGDGCRADCQGRFTKQQTPSANVLLAVVVLARDNAYAFGSIHTALHWDGVTWSIMTLGLNNMTATWANGPDDIYVAGTDDDDVAGVIHFDGTAWSGVNSTNVGGYVRAVYATGPNDIYVANNGTLRHYTTTWALVTMPCSGVTAVAATSAAGLYAGGDNLCRLTATTWAQIAATPVSQLVPYGPAVIALEPVSSQLQGWFGATPFGDPMPIPGSVSAISITGMNETFELLAVGASGVVLQLDAQNVWTRLVVPTELQLDAVAGTDPTNMFIVGEVGTILH